MRGGAMCVPGAHIGQKRMPEPRQLKFGCVGVFWEPKLGPLQEQRSVLNHYTISPTLGI